MTGTAVLTQRHPRLIAGLWFGSFVGLTQLIVGLALQLTLRGLKVSGWPPAMALPNGCLIVVAVCVGAWLGPTLLTRDVSGAEGARRGAWIGIVTGMVAALLAGILAPTGPSASAKRANLLAPSYSACRNGRRSLCASRPNRTRR